MTTRRAVLLPAWPGSAGSGRGAPRTPHASNWGRAWWAASALRDGRRGRPSRPIGSSGFHPPSFMRLHPFRPFIPSGPSMKRLARSSDLVVPSVSFLARSFFVCSVFVVLRPRSGRRSPSAPMTRRSTSPFYSRSSWPMPGPAQCGMRGWGAIFMTALTCGQGMNRAPTSPDGFGQSARRGLRPPPRSGGRASRQNLGRRATSPTRGAPADGLMRRWPRRGRAVRRAGAPTCTAPPPIATATHTRRPGSAATAAGSAPAW